MLELSDDDEQPASPPAAPTTSALPAGKKKHTRRREAPAEDAAEQDAPIALGKRRQRAWEENSGADSFRQALNALFLTMEPSLLKTVPDLTLMP